MLYHTYGVNEQDNDQSHLIFYALVFYGSALVCILFIIGEFVFNLFLISYVI